MSAAERSFNAGQGVLPIGDVPLRSLKRALAAVGEGDSGQSHTRWGPRPEPGTTTIRQRGTRSQTRCGPKPEPGTTTIRQRIRPVPVPEPGPYWTGRTSPSGAHQRRRTLMGIARRRDRSHNHQHCRNHNTSIFSICVLLHLGRGPECYPGAHYGATEHGELT